MFFRILKLDLKKKKVMNILLLLFIILASVFSASGLNNIVTVMNGTDYYFDKAGIGDYEIISKKDDKIFEILDNEKIVKDYTYDLNYLASKSNIEVANQDLDMKSNILFQTIENSSIKFFDKNDQELKNISKGEVYITGSFIKDNGLAIGDKITIVLENEKFDLKIAGIAKDAFLGSRFMGNIRFLMNEEDYAKIINSDNKFGMEECNIFYVYTDNVNEMSKVLSDTSLIFFSGSRDEIKLSYVMDMIIAFIVLVLSVCLVIVSLLILKFTITFTINEEYREIGVMKAIGIKNKAIRNLYIVKYMSLAIIGAIIGYFISIPFGNMLIKSTTENMVLGNTSGINSNIIGSIFIIIVTVLFAYIYTGKVKKATPVDAIRNGQTGERYKAKTIYKMKNSHTRLNLYLAINDILSSPRRFITIIFSFFVCLIFVLGVVITTDTMKSKNLVSTFCTESDVYFLTDDVTNIYSFKNKADFNENKVKKYEKIFNENGMPCDICIELLYKYKVSFNNETYKLTCMQGLNTKITDYVYTEGISPANENEIAITHKISEITGAKIGDRLKINFGDVEKEYIVTAYFQTLNNLGEVIRLNENAPSNFQNLVGSQYFQINFLDDPNEVEIQNRVERIKDLLNIDDVYNAAEFCSESIGVVDTMENVQYLLLTITIIIVILVTLLIELSFVTNEKSQIALLKAIGFRDSQIIKWHIYRLVIATLIAEILAGIFAIPITKLWCNPIFGMMGANDINFFVNPIHIYLVYPGIVLVSTIIISFIASLSTKKIKSSDTANIE